MYREFAAPPRLRHAIACWWVRRPTRSPVRIVPDGCVDIVWRPSLGLIVAGPDTGHWISAAPANEPTIGVRFRPGAGGPALGLPLYELRDRRVALAEVNSSLARKLTDSDDPAVIAQRLAARIAELVCERPPDGVTLAAVARLADRRMRVDRVAADLGISQRHLRRRFDAAVGYGPKTLHRVLRLGRFLSGPHVDLAGAAFAAGYADQAHLTRECRALTGLAPGDWISSFPVQP